MSTARLHSTFASSWGLNLCQWRSRYSETACSRSLGGRWYSLAKPQIALLMSCARRRPLSACPRPRPRLIKQCDAIHAVLPGCADCWRCCCPPSGHAAEHTAYSASSASGSTVNTNRMRGGKQHHIMTTCAVYTHSAWTQLRESPRMRACGDSKGAAARGRAPAVRTAQCAARSARRPRPAAARRCGAPASRMPTGCWQTPARPPAPGASARLAGQCPASRPVPCRL